MFGDDNLDITNEILKVFNIKHKKIKFDWNYIKWPKKDYQKKKL